MMNIFMLTTSFPRKREDFVGIFVYGLAKYLVKDGYNVGVVCPSSSLTKRFEVIDEIKVYRFDYIIPRALQNVAYGDGIFPNLRRSVLARIELPLFLFFFLLKAMILCRGCSLIHAHFIFSGSIAIFVGKIYRIPIVLTAHGSDVDCLEKSRVLRRFGIFILRRVQRVIAVSNSLKQKMVDVGISPDKITVIPNGVDILKFKGTKQDRTTSRLLWVGRLIEEKGVVYLIEAMKWVNIEIPKIKLILIGEGRLKGRLKRLAERLSVQVEFMGELPNSDVLRWMEDVDLFILPSLHEGLPLVLLEAMASCLPVVATSIGGIKDVVVDGETGILIPPKNPYLLAEKIIYLMKNEDLRRRMGENGRERVARHFTWDRIVKDTSRIYKDINI